MEEKQPPVSHNINLIEDDIDAEKKIIEVIIQVKDELDKLQAPVLAVDKGGSSKESTQPSIYKIPEFMKKVQQKAFEPQLVSLGPYHYGKPHLASMEQEKQNAFLRFKAKNKLENSDLIVKSVSNILENLLGSYDKLDDMWKQNRAKFLQVMIVDGCFMLDFFHNCPISLRNMSIDIRRDMLLLENQLPMELLKKLNSILSNQKTDKELRLLICKSMFIKYEEAVVGKELHILDMHRAWLLYPAMDNVDRSGKPKLYEPSDTICQIIPQAIYLREAGVKFKQSDTKSLTDMKFHSKKGVLELPLFVVDDDTETTFLNVMAFEKLHLKAGTKVTSFIILMNNLIDVDRDVALLESKKIIANALGNDQDAADLFGLLGKGVAIDLDSDIIDLQYNLNQYCRKPWRKWSASLQHNYFQNPWAIISVIAAVFGFSIILIQAIYQIVEFHLGGKNK